MNLKTTIPITSWLNHPEEELRSSPIFVLVKMRSLNAKGKVLCHLLIRCCGPSIVIEVLCKLNYNSCGHRSRNPSSEIGILRSIDYIISSLISAIYLLELIMHCLTRGSVPIRKELYISRGQRRKKKREEKILHLTTASSIVLPMQEKHVLIRKSKGLCWSVGLRLACARHDFVSRVVCTGVSSYPSSSGKYKVLWLHT